MNKFCAMLDMSRNGVMKPEEAVNFANIIKTFGYNSIMLYTEDTYEVENEPYFGYMRGRYTIKELKYIVNECEKNNIEVIPCIQTLAHLNQIFRWTKYKKIRDVNDILLANNDKTYELVENMFKTISKVYKSKYIHIGMDEAHMLGLGKYLTINGYKNSFDILLTHLNKIISIANKYCLKPIMWSDMFFKLSNNGEYYCDNPILDDNAINKTPKEVSLVYWDYYHYNEEFYNKMMNAHKKFNNEIWYAGGAWTWTGFAPGNYHTIETVQPALLSARKNGINNIIMTLWGDNGKECSFYSILPSLFAARKFYDGETDLKVIGKEFNKITGENFEDMLNLDLPNCIDGNNCSARNLSKYMFYSDIFSGYLDTTVRECGAKELAENCKYLIDAGKRSTHYTYIFDTLASLCNVLSLKYDYGVRLRKAYNEKNYTTIKALSNEINLILEKIELFYNNFSNLWYKENKPQGFEVQDIRIGGLKQRLKACKLRLDTFIDGKLDSIPELEGELLSYYGDENEKPLDEIPGFAKWSDMATLNIL